MQIDYAAAGEESDADAADEIGAKGPGGAQVEEEEKGVERDEDHERGVAVFSEDQVVEAFGDAFLILVIDRVAVGALPGVDVVAVVLGPVDHAAIVVPTDAERMIADHLAGSFVEHFAGAFAFFGAVVVEASHDGVHGEGEADGGDGDQAKENVNAAFGEAVNQAEQNDDDTAEGEHGKAAAREGRLDDDGAKNVAPEEPVGFFFFGRESGAKEDEADHGGEGGEGILVLEGAPNLVDVVEVFHFEHDEGLPGHGAGKAMENEFEIAIGADEIVGGGSHQGEFNGLQRGHEDVGGKFGEENGEAGRKAKCVKEPHARRHKFHLAPAIENFREEKGERRENDEVEMVAARVAAVEEGGDGEAPFVVGEDATRGHEAHEAHREALGAPGVANEKTGGGRHEPIEDQEQDGFK